MLNFCSTCRNLLEIVFTEAEGACHRCAFCNKTVPITENALLFEEVKATNSLKKPSPYATQDPTVPVFNNIPCQNKACKQREVAAVLIDEVNLKFAYSCRACKTQWTN